MVIFYQSLIDRLTNRLKSSNLSNKEMNHLEKLLEWEQYEWEQENIDLASR